MSTDPNTTKPARIPVARRLRHRIETAAVDVLVWTTARMPRPMVLIFAWILGNTAAVLDRRGRATALENLRLVMPGMGRSAMRGVVRRSYVNFARSFLDLFWFQRLGPQDYRRWVEIQGADEAGDRELLHGGAIHLTPHFGNFEWASLVWGFEGHRMHVVAQDFKNPDLTARFGRLREHSGHRMVPQSGAMLRLMKVLKRGGHVALLTDLNVRPGRAATVIRCFGVPTCVTRLHADLAKRCQRPMVAGICEPIKGGRYSLRILRVFHPPSPDADAAQVDRLVQEVWDVFEQEIRRRPEMWMWMYKHWRYRPDDDPSGYPAYSNRSGAFAKLVRASGNP